MRMLFIQRQLSLAVGKMRNDRRIGELTRGRRKGPRDRRKGPSRNLVFRQVVLMFSTTLKTLF